MERAKCTKELVCKQWICKLFKITVLQNEKVRKSEGDFIYAAFWQLLIIILDFYEKVELEGARETCKIKRKPEESAPGNGQDPRKRDSGEYSHSHNGSGDIQQETRHFLGTRV